MRLNPYKSLIVLLFLYFVLGTLNAQTYQEYNPNDERFKIIALEKAKIRLDNSERDFIAAKKLYEDNFISKDELNLYELQYKTDKLNYDQYMLSVIFDNPYINIMKAVKTKNENVFALLWVICLSRVMGRKKGDGVFFLLFIC